MSIYEDQKKPVAPNVPGVVNPNLVCDKCHKESSHEPHECEHCGWNVHLCTDCFFGEGHWEDYIKTYKED